MPPRICNTMLLALCLSPPETTSLRSLIITEAGEVRQYFSEKAVSQVWRPGTLDHESFFAADKTGLFVNVGELDGEAMCYN